MKKRYDRKLATQYFPPTLTERRLAMSILLGMCNTPIVVPKK